MNLWDLNIEELPCGWESIYKEALVHYPEGTTFHYPATDCQEEINCVYHPTKCREILINRFNQVKDEVNMLLNNREKLELKKFVSGLVNADAELYYLLKQWDYDEDLVDQFSFNPETIAVGYSLEVYGYTNADNKYANLRLVRQA